MRLIYKAIRCVIKEGPRVCIHKIKKRLCRNKDYETWIRIKEADMYEVEPLSYNPKISVIVPVYNVEPHMLRECIDSVRNQTYKNYELILVDDCSTMPEVRETLESYQSKKESDNIIIFYREENGHISKCTNTGISLATGEFIGLLDCDDVLAPNALYEIAKKLNEDSDYDFIYSDEDKLSVNGKKRSFPFFKPDWSPDTMMSLMYTCHFSVFRKSLIDEVGGMRVGFEGSQDYDLVLRVMEKTNRIGHIPKILYHWRTRKESTAASTKAKPYILDSTKRAKEEALKRRGLEGHLEYLDFCNQYRVVYHVMGHPKVSVIIPSKDHPDILTQCIESVRAYTTYDNYEMIVVDNGSCQENKQKYETLCEKHHVVYHYAPMEFNFSRMCNIGAKLATGDFFLFLNDDIEVLPDSVISDKRINDWMERMLGHAQVPHVGAVGCKLLYPHTNKIQHSGVMNLINGPAHAFLQMDDGNRYSWDRNKLEYNFSAVTGACLMISKEKYNQVGGFEESLSVGYNDVDLCVKLLETDYYNVLRNDVTLVHHESLSRGDDRLNKEKAFRLRGERDILFKRHPWYQYRDPFYNENLAKNKGDYSIDNFDYLMENHLEVVTSPQPLDDGFDENDMPDWCLEDVIVGDIIWITGYAYRKGYKSKAPMVLILSGDEGIIYKIHGKNQYRWDIIDMYDSKKAAFSGFQFVFEKKGIKKGAYDIGLSFENKYLDLNYKMEIKA